PAVGDDHFGRSLTEVFGTLAEVYYARTRDEDVRPLLVPGRVSDGDERARGLRRGYVAPLWLTPVWQPQTRPPVRESVNFPASGYAILRARAPGRDVEEVQLLLQYGPHGGGHGHLDKLNVVLYANGRVQAPDLGICNYSLPESHDWFRQTVSHNTVVVDQVSQHRIGGELERFEAGPRVQVADASAHDYQHGVRMRRTAILVDGAFVIDVFGVGGAGPNRQRGRQIDWVYRNFGELRVSAELVEDDKALGKDNGYQHIRDVRRGSADGTWTATFASEGQGVRLTMLGEAETEVIAATAPGTTLDERLDVLFARRQAPTPHARTRYLTVIEPFRGQPAIGSVRELAVSTEHRGLESEAAGLAVERGGSTVYVAVSYAWKPVPTRYGELATDGAVVVLCVGDGGALEYLYAVETTRIEWGGLALRADAPLTFHLERGDGAEYVLANLSDRDGTLRIDGIGRAESPLAVAPRCRLRIVPG
ncbi:MAG: heparinase II/III family protein, partial [Spirochaetaceae bacterium]|nr:heparinase II/III family protein [Spirochaetaceae bacterium]